MRRTLLSHGAICSAWIACLMLTMALRDFPDVDEIIRNSVTTMHHNWAVADRFNRCERDVTKSGTNTYAVTMILGSPYYRLTAVDDKPLSDDERRRQQHDEDAARCTRERSSRRPGSARREIRAPVAAESSAARATAICLRLHIRRHPGD